MRWKALVAAILAGLLVAFVVPAYLLPLVAGWLGFNQFKGLRGVVITFTRLSGIPFPLPLFLSPDAYIFAGFVPGGISLALFIYLRGIYRRNLRLKEQLVEFIPLVAAYVRTGMPMTQTLEVVAGIIKPPISEYAERFAKLIKLGEDPSVAFEKVFGKTPREVRAVLSSLVIAMASGGRVADVLGEAEHYVEQLNRMEDLRKYRLESYKMTLVLAVIGFVFTALTTLWLLNAMSGVSTKLPGIAMVDMDAVSSSYFLTSLILVVMSSIVTSRIIYNTMVLATKYLAILFIVTALSFAVFFILI